MLYLSSHQILTFQNFITEIDKSVNPVWFLVVFSWAVKVVVTAHLNSPTTSAELVKKEGKLGCGMFVPQKIELPF